MSLETVKVALLETNVDGDAVVSRRWTNIVPCDWRVMGLFKTICIARMEGGGALRSFSQEAGKQEGFEQHGDGNEK